MNDERPILTHLDCFSGLGAWTLAASWLGGIRTVAFVENDARCQAFLAKAWPEITIEPDIRTLDGNRYPQNQFPGQ